MSATAAPVDRTIAAADLPALVQKFDTREEVSMENLPLHFKMFFDTPHGDDDTRFNVMKIAFDDGLTLYFDEQASSAYMYMVDTLNAPAMQLLQVIHNNPESYKGVFRVIE